MEIFIKNNLINKGKYGTVLRIPVISDSVVSLFCFLGQFIIDFF
jgi:hypothetical protein